MNLLHNVLWRMCGNEVLLVKCVCLPTPLGSGVTHQPLGVDDTVSYRPWTFHEKHFIMMNCVGKRMDQNQAVIQL